LIRDLVRREELCNDDLGCMDTEEVGQHGPNCPRAVLDAELASTGAGRLVQRALLIRREIHCAKVRYAAREISYETLLVLGMIEDEEAAFTDEKGKRPPHG
jgi:hypothetical protein